MSMPKAPQLEMGVVVSFGEILNRPATIEGAEEFLARYRRESVLLVLAKLGAALRMWHGPIMRKITGWAAICSRTRRGQRLIR